LPGTAGPGTIAVIISAASTLDSRGGPILVQHLAFVTVTVIIAVLFWACLRGATVWSRYWENPALMQFLV
jgi:multiple antibiotic resistance protein